MKKAITRIAILLLLTAYCFLPTAYSQVPQAFNYQAVARDNSGNPISSHAVGINIIIHQSTAGGTIVYSETFTKTTNQFGLFTLPIGQGAGTYGNFNSIVWSTGNYWLQVQIDPTGGTSYTDMGTSQLLSVPYAMYAANSGSSSNLWTDHTNWINPNINSGTKLFDNSGNASIDAQLGSSSAGTGWGTIGNVKAGIIGRSNSLSFQAGVYGFCTGSAINETGVIGVWDDGDWGGLGYKDASGIYGVFTAGSFGIKAGSYATSFKTTTQSSTINYTLPSAQGTAGSVLMNDGSGNLSWSHTVGELYGGGIIVAVWKVGGVEHGLIASLTDIGTSAWSNITTAIPSVNMTDGQSNTNAIIGQGGHTSSAAKLCDDYSSGGYSDWYLPALWELDQCDAAAYIVNTVLGNTNGFNTGTGYWSSSESPINFNSTAYSHNFTISASDYNDKTTVLSVRAVRRF